MAGMQTLRQAVIRKRERYEVFERMHSMCFHYEFEHEAGNVTLTSRARTSCTAAPSIPLRPDWFQQRVNSSSSVDPSSLSSTSSPESTQSRHGMIARRFHLQIRSSKTNTL